MILKPDVVRRVATVLDATTNSFVELTRLARLDPACAFIGANLRGVDLRDQYLAGFDFTEADLTGSDLRGADLSLVRGLEQAILIDTIVDHNTRWPTIGGMATIEGVADADFEERVLRTMILSTPDAGVVIWPAILGNRLADRVKQLLDRLSSTNGAAQTLSSPPPK